MLLKSILLFFFMITCLLLAFAVAWLVFNFYRSPTEPKYLSFKHWLTGRKTGSKPESNTRRLFTIYAGSISYIIITVAIGQQLLDINSKKLGSDIATFMSAAFCLVAIAYFVNVVLFTPFRTDSDFTVNPVRLAHNTLISAAIVICSYAVFYKTTGLLNGGECCEIVSLLDALYFSTVTFSTLGYGDFSPCDGTVSRMMASGEALIGNIHLGVFVAAIFLSVNDKSNEQPKDPSQK